MITELPRPRLEPFGYDPICGSRLPALYRANPYSDDQRTYFFCSAACRRFFLEHGELQISTSTRKMNLVHDFPNGEAT